MNDLNLPRLLDSQYSKIHQLKSCELLAKGSDVVHFILERMPGVTNSMDTVGGGEGEYASIKENAEK